MDGADNDIEALFGNIRDAYAKKKQKNAELKLPDGADALPF